LTEQTRARPQITIYEWERSLESASLDSLVEDANFLHKTVGLQLRQTALDIWRIGRVLRREKDLVGHGNWMSHCRRRHPEISLDSIERYMRVGQIPIDQLPVLLDKTPRQAYRMLGVVKEKPSLPTYPAKQGTGEVNSSHMRNFEEEPWKHAQIECPYCDRTIEFAQKGDYFIVHPILRRTEET